MSTTLPTSQFTTSSSSPNFNPPYSRALKLWDRAYNTLNDEVRQSIDFGQPDKKNIIEEVLRLAEDKRQQCIRSRWRIPRRNGEVIVLRDVFEKVATFARKFREIGDAAVQYDPAHAALPWAGVRLVLQIIINDSSAFGAMMEGLELATSCIDRYTIIEEVYLREWSEAGDQLAASLVEVYAAILAFLGMSIRFFSDTKGMRLLKNSMGLTDNRITELVEDIARKQLRVEQDETLVQGVRQLGLVDLTRILAAKLPNIDELVSRDDLASHHTDMKIEHLQTRTDVMKLLNLASDLSKPLHRTAIALEDLKDDKSMSQRLDILKWTSTIPYSQHHNNVRKDRIAGTGQWLFTHPEFQRWGFSSCSSILWLHGIPGSGKTMLTSLLIDTLVSEKARNIFPPVAYFYCERNSAEPERSTPTEILACIARQLCADDCTLPIRRPLVMQYNAIKGKGFEARRMDLDELVRIVIDVNRDNPAIIIVDALDECDPDTRHELLESLDMILRESENVVKLFVTSRDDHDIVCRLESSPNLYITAQDNKADIGRFVEVELAKAIDRGRLLHGDVSTNLRSEISQTLNDGAQGMFRWVSLQLQNLCNPQHMKIEADVARELGKLPKTLSAIYEKIYEQIPQSGPASKLLAERALQWMLATQRPLKPSELIAGILVSYEESEINLETRDLLSMTCNLLVIDKFLNIVRFAHASVREYLEKRPEYAQSKNDKQVAIACLKEYEQHQRLTWSTLERHFSTFGVHFTTLRSYSCQYWPVHVLGVQDVEYRSETTAVLKAALMDTLDASVTFMNWRAHVATYAIGLGSLQAALRASTTPLQTCCLFGFSEILDMFDPTDIMQHDLTMPPMSNASEYTGMNALHMAVCRGHRQVAQKLLTIGFGVNDITTTGQDALYLAVCMQHNHLLPILAQHGADLNRMNPVKHREVDRSNNRAFISPRSSAIECSISRESYSTAMGHRMASGGTRSAVDQEIESPLHHAASQGFFECTTQLLKLGADVEVADNVGATPLQRALETRNYGILNVLLQHGANPNGKIVHGRTVLHLAVAMDDIESVRILLTYGADPLQPDDIGMTASYVAYRFKHHAVAGLLPEGSNTGPLKLGEIISDEEDDWADSIATDSSLQSSSLPQIAVSEWGIVNKNIVRREARLSNVSAAASKHLRRR